MHLSEDDLSVYYTSLLTELRVAKARKGAPVQQLADELGVSHQWLQRRLTGTTRLTVTELVRVARVLGTDAPDVMRAVEQRLGLVS